MAVLDAMTKLENHEMELEEKAFDLVLKQLCYDVEVWRVHTQKCSDYGVAVQWQKPLMEREAASAEPCCG